MGLDTTHGAFHGPYSHFNSFRHKLAERIGINLTEYAGYNSGWKEGDPYGKDLESIDHLLKPLFNHSDCDGHLTPLECISISSGLEQIIDGIRLDELEGNFNMQWFYQCCEQFKEGCRLAALRNENLEFN